MTPTQLGQIVNYAEPMADEVGLSFRIIEIEVETDWCLMEALVDMNILPTQVANLSELVVI